MRLPAALFLLLLVPACGDGPPIAKVDLSISVSPDTVEAGPGEPFDLRVVRIWRKDLRPEAFSDDALSPLEVERLHSERREDGDRVEETLHYRAVAVSLENVTLPALRFRARSATGSEIRTASGNPVVVRIRRALDPEEPGDAEFPDGPLSGGPSLLIPAAVLLLAGAGLALALLRARRRSLAGVTSLPHAPGPEVLPPPAPHEVALGRLARLRSVAPGGRDEMAAQHGEASGILREYLREGLGLRAVEMTTEECLEASQVASGEGVRAFLADSLSRCDLSKFAGYAPSMEERGRMLAAAEGFVRQTAPREGGE